MKLAIACDHAGYELMQKLADIVRAEGHQVDVAWPETYDPKDDYPDAAAALGRAVAAGKAERGILL